MTRRLAIRLIIIIFPLITISQNQELLGTWESKDSDQPMHMIFDEEGFLTFKVEGRLMGGKGYNVDGNLLRMTYKTHGKDSMLKITITLRDLLQKKVLKKDTGTIVFRDPNNIEVCFQKAMEDRLTENLNDCRYFLKIM